MEEQGMNEKVTLEKLYDAGYTNALLQLRVHINQIIDKPNSQTKQVFDLINVMLEVIEDKEI
jgi:hypothetical protein